MNVSVALQSKNETIQSCRVPHTKALCLFAVFKQLFLDIFIVIIALSRVSVVVAFVIAMFNDLLYGDYYCVFYLPTYLMVLWLRFCRYSPLTPMRHVQTCYGKQIQLPLALRCTFSTTVIYLDYWTFVCVR